KLPYKDPTHLSQQQEPWNRLNSTPTFTSIRRDACFFDPKIPKDDLDFRLAALYDHHTGAFKNKTEILLHQETIQDMHGSKIHFSGECFHSPPAPITSRANIRHWINPKKESIHSIQGSIVRMSYLTLLCLTIGQTALFINQSEQYTFTAYRTTFHSICLLRRKMKKSEEEPKVDRGKERDFSPKNQDLVYPRQALYCVAEDDYEVVFLCVHLSNDKRAPDPITDEVRCMMYGFGDDQNPYTESVDILEDLVIEFITEMTHKAMSIGRQGRVQVEDIVFLIRKDPRKFARVKDLLTMNEELKRARKAFDEANYGS
ncbi:hypothetical protein STEG23_003528, partial [Scotinomys teguina]